MSNQIPVLYTEQKTKKVKIWLDGYLVPRTTLNSARLISAGKHEIDVVFYSSIDDIKPGREFETDRYLITVEESNNVDQPCPRPSYAVDDPTMRNRPKSGAFVPPRLVPKAEPPPPPMPSIERHNPNQWGYAGMTAAMKRTTYDDAPHESYINHASKIPKSSHFIPPTFQKYQPISPAEPPPPLPPSNSTPPIQQQQQRPGLLNDTLVSQLLNNARPPPPSVSNNNSSIKQGPQISWSNWDDKKADDEDTTSTLTSHDENLPEKPNSIKQTVNWDTLVKSAVSTHSIDQPKQNSETMPKFDFDDSSFDTLFDNLNQ